MSIRFVSFVLAVLLPMAVIAEDKEKPIPATQAELKAVDARLARIERLLDSQGLVEMLNQLEHLQTEVQRMRGDVEFQTHSIEQMRKRQRELYLDVDQRLQKIEAGGIREAALRPRNVATTTPPPLEMLNTPKDEVAGRDSAAGLRVDNRTPEEQGTEVEKEKYRQAFNMLKAGQYEKSIERFRGFLNEYSKSAYADNAQYWLGEAYYMLKQYPPAIEEYQILQQNYPKSQKLTHALLKIGFSLHELGQIEKAEAALVDLRTRYPGSTAARMAGERLQKLKIEQATMESSKQVAPVPEPETNEPKPIEPPAEQAPAPSN